MTVVDVTINNWKKAVLTSGGTALGLIVVVLSIGVKDVEFSQSIISGLVSGLVFSTVMASITTFWFSFSRKQPWMPVMISILPILLAISFAYVCYELFDIRDARHETAIAQGLSDFLRMITALIATSVAIIFSLVILLKHPTNNMEEE